MDLLVMQKAFKNAQSIRENEKNTLEKVKYAEFVIAINSKVWYCFSIPDPTGQI